MPPVRNDLREQAVQLDAQVPTAGAVNGLVVAGVTKIRLEQFFREAEPYGTKSETFRLRVGVPLLSVGIQQILSANKRRMV